MGRVDSSKTGVGNSVSEDGVGSMDSAKTISVSKTSISQTSISKSSIWVSIGTIENSSISLSICLSLPLLAATGNRGSQVVGADTNIGGVGQTSRGSSNSVDRVGYSSMRESSISKTISVSQTSISKSSIGVSIGSIQNSGISLRLSLCFPLAKIVTIVTKGIRVSCIGKGGSSTGNSLISSVHTGSCLATEGTVRIGSIAISSIEDSSISFGISSSVGSSHEGRGDNKELHIE